MWSGAGSLGCVYGAARVDGDRSHLDNLVNMLGLVGGLSKLGMFCSVSVDVDVCKSYSSGVLLLRSEREDLFGNREQRGVGNQ